MSAVESGVCEGGVASAEGELCSLRASSSASSISVGDRGGNRTKNFMLRALGPGLLVCLADTDDGCLIVASQSGAKYGYSLLSLQIVLIPVLFLAQELTIRLGIYLKEGHTACVRAQF